MPSLSPSRTCRLSVSASQILGQPGALPLSPTLHSPSITKHTVPKSGCSTPVHCHLLLEAPSSLPKDLQGIKSKTQTCLPHRPLPAKPCALLALPLTQKAPARLNFFQFEITPFLTGLQTFARPDPFARYKPSSLFPHLANSSLPFKSQLSHVSSRNPSLTPRNPGGCLP